MSELLTFNNDIMDIIVSKLDPDSHLIVGLACKELYKVIKTFNENENKKLIGSLKYLTSTLSLFKYAHKNGCPLNNRTIDKIFTSNESFECLKYAHENGCPWSEETCLLAAENGQLECLKYLHENGCPWSTQTCQEAVENGQLECLKYCKENGCPE